MDEMLSRIKRVLKARLRIDAAEVDQCGRDTPLLGQGIGLDSVESLSLAAAIEEEFNIVIDDNELTAKLFATLGSLAAFVEVKTGRTGFPAGKVGA